MKIQAKLLLATSTTFAIVLLTSSFYTARDLSEIHVEDAVDRAIAVVGAAQQAGAHITAMHDSKAIDMAALLQKAREEMARGNGDPTATTAFAAIPVIAAIESAKGAAKAAGIDLTLTARNARNPKYAPESDPKLGAFRGRLLDDLRQQVERGGQNHLWRIDEEHDVLVFQSAIRLEQSCMACHGDPRSSPTGNGKDAFGFAMENWQVGDVHGAFEVRTPLGPIHAEANSHALASAGIGALLGLAGLAVLALILRRTIVQPIEKTVKTLESSAGDLRIRLDEASRDEIGEMGRWLNQFIASVQTTVQTIATRAASVSTASTQLTATAHTLATGAERTKTKTGQVAAAAEQMTANMNSVSQSSEAMSGTTRTVAAAVEELTASIGEVAKSAENAAQVAGEAAELTRSSNAKVAALGAAANEIGRVIETIQDIAEQTNLLALNATIEAARAGEAGKGFSVVANEVKDLARQTAEATHDIRQRIERIQASTTESVAAIAAIDQVIVKVNQSSQAIATSVAEQRTATQEISSNLAQSTRAIETVARNVSESVVASKEIGKAIAEVDDQAGSSASGAEETSAAGSSMANLAAELLAVVGQFKV